MACNIDYALTVQLFLIKYKIKHINNTFQRDTGFIKLQLVFLFPSNRLPRSHQALFTNIYLSIKEL